MTANFSKTLFVLFITTLLFSCTKEETEDNGNNDSYEGVWINPLTNGKSELAIGVISGEPANRVYFCLSATGTFEKGYLNQNKITWDTGKLKQMTLQKSGSTLNVTTSDGVYNENYNLGSWSNDCGSLSNQSDCAFTQWTGTGGCNSGYYPVYTGVCAPAGYPFYNTATKACYSTCNAAYIGNPSGQIYRSNENGGGEGKLTVYCDKDFSFTGSPSTGNYVSVKIEGATQTVSLVVTRYSTTLPGCGQVCTDSGGNCAFSTHTMPVGTYSAKASLYNKNGVLQGSFPNQTLTITKNGCSYYRLTM